MARIRVIHNQTGKVGTIDENDYNPDLFQRVKSPLEKAYDVSTAVPRFLFPEGTKFVEQNVGASAKSAKQLLQGDVSGARETATQNRMGILGPLGSGGQMARASREGLTSIVLNKALSALGNKIAGPTSKLKLGGPSKMKASADTVKRETWNSIDELLGGKAGQTQSISTKEVTSVLDDLYKQAKKINNVEAIDKLDKISDIVARTGEKITPDQAVYLSKELKNIGKLYSTVTGDLTSTIGRDTGKQAALKLSSDVSQQAKNKVSGLGELLNQYGTYSNISRDLSKPLKNWWLGGLAGTVATPTLGPALGGPLAVGTTLAAMPYTRTLARKLVGQGLEKVLNYPLIGGINQLFRSKADEYSSY